MKAIGPNEKLPPWPDFRGYDKADLIARRSEARVGALVFVYDQNVRVYRRSHDFGGGCGAIERYHYVVTRIESETRVSWILDRYGEKIPKKNPGQMYGRDDVEDAIWRRIHAHKIGDCISRMDDPDLLRKIAALIGYEAKDALE